MESKTYVNFIGRLDWRRRPDHFGLCLASALLLLLGLGYLIHGSYNMFTQSGDYRMHWVEERYVFRGKNPADIFARIQAEANHKPLPTNGRPNAIDPDLGPADGTYPLWSYFTATIVTWPPSFASGRFYNGVLNLLVLIGLLIWAYRLGAEEDRFLGFFFVCSVLAVNSICTTFIVGQYGVQVLAVLLATSYFDQKNRWLAAGICFGIAMIKLSIAAPFALPFMAKGHWKLLFVAGVYLVIGTLLIWPLVKTNPIEIMGQMTTSAEFFEGHGYSLNNFLEIVGVGAQTSMKMAALGTLGLAMAIMYIWRSSSMLVLYSIAAVASRAWCYHRMYDNLVLVILLLALGQIVWRTRSLMAFTSFILVGVSLWTPARLTEFSLWLVAQWAIWIEGLAVLLFFSRSKLETLTDVGGPIPLSNAMLGNKSLER
jgi:hypothetical protein